MRTLYDVPPKDIEKKENDHSFHFRAARSPMHVLRRRK